MHATLLLARLIHVVTGVFWAGTIIFNATYLFPSLRDAGPDAAKVAAGLMKRRFLDVLPAVALLTILSGLWLYWTDSAGSTAFMRSGTGMAFGTGAVLALVGFALGVGIMRPAMLRAASLSMGAASLASPEKEQHLSQAQALRMRAGAVGRVVAWLLTLAASAMAIARYV